MPNLFLSFVLSNFLSFFPCLSYSESLVSLLFSLLATTLPVSLGERQARDEEEGRNEELEGGNEE